MPAALPPVRPGLAGFGRGFMRFSTGVGRTVRPAVVPLAALGGGALLVNQAGKAADNVGRAVNPPADKVPVDLNGDGVPESYLIMDRKTGLTNIFGQPPAKTQENDRQESQKLLILAAAGAAVAVAALVMGRGR